MISTVLPAYKYLIEQRGLNEQTIQDFFLAYVDQQGEIYIGADFEGTLPKLDSRFNHSTLFPIQSVYGDTIGVSCRPLIKGPVKYINSTYEKADHLYGLNVSYKECLKTQSCYLVEGNLDLLQLYQAGIKNVAALLGSNFSFKQLCLLSRFVKKVILVPDGDQAGIHWREKIKASFDNKFRDSDLKFTFIQLPNGFDPDKYILTYGKESFLSLPEKDL